MEIGVDRWSTCKKINLEPKLLVVFSLLRNVFAAELEIFDPAELITNLAQRANLIGAGTAEVKRSAQGQPRTPPAQLSHETSPVHDGSWGRHGSDLKARKGVGAIPQ